MTRPALLLIASALATIPFLASAPFVSAAPTAPVPAGGASDALSALEEGNLLFENGDFEGAAEAYRRGYDPERPHATLIYNLATSLHHAERLPEAILWYRRGAENDPWTEENLYLARKSLGSQKLPLTGFQGWVAQYGSRLADGSIVWVWLACLAAGLLPAARLKPAATAAALGALIYVSLAIVHSRLPLPVVLLSDCVTASGDLPAGTEAWATETSRGWEIAGLDEAHCPLGSLEIVNR